MAFHGCPLVLAMFSLNLDTKFESICSRRRRKSFLSLSDHPSNHWSKSFSWHVKILGGLSVTFNMFMASNKAETLWGTAFSIRSAIKSSLCMSLQEPNQWRTHMTSCSLQVWEMLACAVQRPDRDISVAGDSPLKTTANPGRSHTHWSFPT